MENIICQPLKKEDVEWLQQLLKVYEEAFEKEDFQMPDSDYLESLLCHPSVLFYVALLKAQVVGGLTVYFLPMAGCQSTEAYIYDLAVKPAHQRSGIGRKLIEGLKEHCQKLGHKVMFVQADLEDQHAIDFYNATGAEMAEVRHFTYEGEGKGESVDQKE